MALIVPPEGRTKETARALLDLAGDTPEIVRTVHAGTAFEVPDALADLYHGESPKPSTRRRGKAARTTTEE